MIQLTAVLAAIVYSGVMSLILLKLVGLAVPLRADRQAESVGMDVSQHGEEAYVHAEGSGTA
jgi:Amt family ammonium transporter